MERSTRAALVTGASQGLGLALSHALAARGFLVAMVARNGDRLARAVEAVRTGGGHAFAVPGDLGNKEDIHRIAGAASALVGPIEVLVHNASMLGPVPMPLLLDTECEDFEAVLQTNLLGPFRLSRIVAGSMALRGHGTVLHVTSDASVSAYANWGAYGVSKAALDHLARSWAAELDAVGVRFVSVDPGEMDTQMHADALPDADRSTLAQPRDVAARVVDLIEHVSQIPNGARLEIARWEVRS